MFQAAIGLVCLGFCRASLTVQSLTVQAIGSLTTGKRHTLTESVVCSKPPPKFGLRGFLGKRLWICHAKRWQKATRLQKVRAKQKEKEKVSGELSRVGKLKEELQAGVFCLPAVKNSCAHRLWPFSFCCTTAMSFAGSCKCFVAG